MKAGRVKIKTENAGRVTVGVDTRGSGNRPKVIPVKQGKKSNMKNTNPLQMMKQIAKEQQDFYNKTLQESKQRIVKFAKRLGYFNFNSLSRDMQRDIEKEYIVRVLGGGETAGDAIFTDVSPLSRKQRK